MAAQLWKLLAKVNPLRIKKIDQSISNLQTLANLVNTDIEGHHLEEMVHQTADLLGDVLDIKSVK